MSLIGPQLQEKYFGTNALMTGDSMWTGQANHIPVGTGKSYMVEIGRDYQHQQDECARKCAERVALDPEETIAAVGCGETGCGPDAISITCSRLSRNIRLYKQIFDFICCK